MNIIDSIGSENIKIRIEVDEKIEEDEVIIRCKKLNDEACNIKKALAEIISSTYYKKSSRR